MSVVIFVLQLIIFGIVITALVFQCRIMRAEQRITRELTQMWATFSKLRREIEEARAAARRGAAAADISKPQRKEEA